MGAKEYLGRLERLDTIISQKLQELGELRMKAASPAGAGRPNGRARTSPSGDAPFVRLVGRIVELEAEIDGDVDRFVDERRRIIRQIQGLDDPRHIEMLFKRYVEYKGLKTICAEMKLSYGYARRLHGCALQSFEDRFLKPAPDGAADAGAGKVTKGNKK